MKRSKNAGFALLWLLSFLPIALFCVCTFLYLMGWIQPQEMTLQICRSQLLQGLSGIGDDLSEFLNLNVQVMALRENRAQANLELKMAIASNDVFAIAGAEEQLQIVIGRQEALRGQQNEKLRSLNFRLQELQEKTKNRIQNSQHSWSQQIKEHYFYSGSPHFVAPARLAVRAVPSLEDDGPPTYEPLDNFVENQSLHISWQQQLKPQTEGAHSWTLNPLNQQTHCGASLTPTPSGFRPILVADKSSLSSCSWCR